ncbi:MAG: tetratricopeptide repeat protein [Bacteroidota bacterium]
MKRAALLLLPWLAACSTPAYVDQGKAERAGVLDLNPVVFQVHPAFGPAAPDCIAVLPLAVAESGEPRPTGADAARVRLSLYAHLLTQAKRGIRPERVDKVLAEVKGDPVALGQRLNCAALMQGTVTEYGSTFLGLYSSVTVGADLRLVRAADGAVLWQGRHVAANRDGGVPLDPVGLAVGLYGAIDNIRDEQVLRVTDDLARRLVSTIPDTAPLALDDPGETPPVAARPADPLAEARHALAAGEYKVALVAAEQAIAADGGNAEAWFLKGRVLMLDGDGTAAEKAIVKAAALDRHNPRILNALGALAADRGDAPRALAAYRMAIDAAPANGFAWYNSAVLLAEGGEAAEAADAFYAAALAYLKSGDPARAERSLGQLHRLSDPRTATVETALARWSREAS